LFQSRKRKNFAGNVISMLVYEFPWLGTSLNGPAGVGAHCRTPAPGHRSTNLPDVICHCSEGFAGVSRKRKNFAGADMSMLV
jgi:hypothetical protein